MANKNDCILAPEINGEPSMLYENMLKKNKIKRPLTNLIYSQYKASNMADVMDKVPDSNGGQKYKRNFQGEHEADDVLEFIDYNNLVAEMMGLNAAEDRIGATVNGQRVNFSDSMQALTIADKFNSQSNGNTMRGLVAQVVKHGDNYNIILHEKNSRTFEYPVDIKQRLKAWDIYQQVFNAAGVDINALPDELKTTVNPYNTMLADILINIQGTAQGILTKRSALMLLAFNQNSPHVQRLVNAFGSLEGAAEAIYNNSHNLGTYSIGQQTLMRRAVLDAKNFQGVDLKALRQQVNQTTQQVRDTSPEKAIKDTLESLHNKYGIDVNEIHGKDKKIKTLSEAAFNAAFTLQRRIRELKKMKGDNAKGKQLDSILKQLLKELECKRYFFGIMNFLTEAVSDIKTIESTINNTQQTGTDIDKAIKMAETIQNLGKIKDQYYPLISALANENLSIDESIDQIDIDNIRSSARDLKQIFDKYYGDGVTNKGVIGSLSDQTMVNLLTNIVGDKAPDGQTIANLVQMAAVDSSSFDYLYSVGRASNPVIAAMGRIIRTAQDSRDGIINAISATIRKETDRLYKAGHNSEFIYADDGHIISDIDWETYNKEKKKAAGSFKASGLRGWDLKQAVEDWEEQNTEERVVDVKSGRTERVPNSNYRLNNGLHWNDKTNKMEFDNTVDLTKEQQDYYNNMMQLKGEIGTLLPAYAQKQYLPPQLRRTMLDAVAKAKGARDVWRAVKNKFKDIYTIREDDTNYTRNGIIEGEEYKIVESDYDDTALRKIPIFFVNKVEQGELLKNFSSGLAALASTAVNYHAMNNVKDVVEFIGDFTINQQPTSKDRQADVIKKKGLSLFKDVVKRSRNVNTEDIVKGFIDKHIYLKNMTEDEENNAWMKLWSNVIGYTSFKGLSTNLPGAVANMLMGEFQMLIEAGAGEFYGFKDYMWANDKLFGGLGAAAIGKGKAFQGAGIGGELAELLTNNMSHRSTLFREKFDPLSENFSDKGHKKYYKSAFRQLVSHDCSFIGYSAGEYLIHYVNMYAILHNKNNDVLLNGKRIHLFDAYEVKKASDDDANPELVLEQGVTDLDGNAIDVKQMEDKIRRTIKFCNDNTHGAMNTEDKGLIHQRWWGRGIMNFRQWMVEHYSRRFRKEHFDATLGQMREGYWRSIMTERVKDKLSKAKETKQFKYKLSAMGLMLVDFAKFMFMAQSKWKNLTEHQKYNVKRVRAEFCTWLSLMGLSFGLGDPDEHKKDWWTRFWIYETQRLLLDTEASMPVPKALKSGLTILQSPMAGVNTLNSLLYAVYGLTNGDLWTDLKSGPHKGENKYWTNVKKHVLPFYKHYEQLMRLDEDKGLFQVFTDTPTNH